MVRLTPVPQTRLTRRIHALVAVADGLPVDEIAQTLGVGEQTCRNLVPEIVSF